TPAIHGPIVARTGASSTSSAADERPTRGDRGFEKAARCGERIGRSGDARAKEDRCDERWLIAPEAVSRQRWEARSRWQRKGSYVKVRLFIVMIARRQPETDLSRRCAGLIQKADAAGIKVVRPDPDWHRGPLAVC